MDNLQAFYAFKKNELFPKKTTQSVLDTEKEKNKTVVKAFKAL